MTVDPDRTREIVRHELEKACLDGLNVEVDPDYDELVVTVRMTSPVDGELYVAEFECSNYREEPPAVELLHPESGERGVPAAFFQDGTTLIATPNSGPIICHQFNRLVYERDDVHNNWTLAGWEQDADEYTTLGAMIGRIYGAISDPNEYQGRYEEIT